MAVARRELPCCGFSRTNAALELALLPLPRAFVPIQSLGDRLLIGEPLLAELEDIREGAWRNDDGAVVPVVVRRGRDQWGPDDIELHASLAARRRVRTALAGRGAPRVLARIVDDGPGDRPRGSGDTAGFVEEWVGDVRVVDLVSASMAAGGVLPIGVALAIARGYVTPFAAFERAQPSRDDARALYCAVNELFVDVGGRLRGLVASDPPPAVPLRFRSMRLGTLKLDVLRYLSPEEFRGERDAERSSRFSFGVLLFEMVGGARRFARHDDVPARLLMALASERMPSLAAVRPDAPDSLVQLVARLTAHRPADRTDRWSDILAAINDAALRTEQATDDDVAAVVRGLLPEVFAAARERREQLALLDVAGLTKTLPPLPGLALAGSGDERVDVDDDALERSGHNGGRRP